MEAQLSATTIGLVELQDFKRKKIQLEKDGTDNLLASKLTKKKKEEAILLKLSFGDDEAETLEQNNEESQNPVILKKRLVSKTNSNSI